MFKLIQNELMKIFKRPGTYVMIGLLVLIVGIVGTVIKVQENQSVPNQTNWRQEVQQDLKEYKSELDDMGNGNTTLTNYLKKEIAVNEYRLEHNIPPTQKSSVWTFVDECSGIIQFAGLFTIIIAAGIVASEFNWGTIKLLLIRPISRSRILIAKYLTVVSFALMMLVLLFGLSSLIGVILFGTPDQAVPYLNFVNGKVTEQSMFFHLVVFYGLKSITMIMLTTMAFMISAVFRNSSLAIGISIFLMFTGSQLTSILAPKFEWAKFVLFANTDLIQYFEGMPMVEGMTLTFSIIMLVVYFLLFQFLAFSVFKKRDVAA
ncbi:ABC transporter permease [Bacillus sp. OK048]|uniref:ABC transporter permease n=1 Tax=Bacillus sp. OK048 TaxID=1882761 RepID=UPI0008865670|nr:ABC transporter permease [Bacillus sp. OK048]SDM85764.1 ABC-2 type transport system permease protein [Bacillus sp. OK048]